MDVIKDRICVKYDTENIETKGETADYQQFLLLFQCFPKPFLLGTSKRGLVWERTLTGPCLPDFDFDKVKTEMSRIIMTSVKEAKAALRKELKQRLAAMTDSERLRQSELIANKLFNLPDYKASQRVCLYLHMKEEVQTYSILKNVFNSNKEVFIPQYIGSNMKMVQLSSLAEYESLPETKWKIKQPADDDTRLDALDTGGLDLILMPGLGFTTSGDRIGRGKGYYDTYLEECHAKGFKPRTVALAYRQQICDSIPVSETDVRFDMVLYPSDADL